MSIGDCDPATEPLEQTNPDDQFILEGTCIPQNELFVTDLFGPVGIADESFSILDRRLGMNSN